MKRVAVIFSLFCAFNLRAADLVVSNNAIINIFGDSEMVDDQAPSVGYRFPDFLESYYQLNYPNGNIHVFNLGRSGGDMDDRLTNNIQKNGLALWGYQSNSFQHIGISHATDNSPSNSIWLGQSNCFQAPLLMSDGDNTLVAHTGWAATHIVNWIGLGQIPALPDGSSVEQGKNYAGTNGGWTFGVRGVDWWYSLVAGITNNPTLGGWQKGGHPGPAVQLAMTFAFLEGITTDTNISTAIVDWNSTTPVDTNHCVISSISRSGNTMTLNRLDDRLPFAWDYTNNFEVSMTNDCSDALTMYPQYANRFRYTITVQNLPAGSYQYCEDGELIGVFTSTQLANGVNLFTNFIGPTGRQRQEVLGRIRDKEHVGRTTHLPGSAGDGVGMVSYGSNAGAQWSAGKRGDDLIAALDFKVKDIWALDALTAAAAVPTNHVDTLTLITPRFVPFHR